MSHRAFGFATPDTDKLNPSESKELAAAVDSLLGEGSIRAVLRDWADRGVTNTQGRPWQRAAFRRLLCNPKIAGVIVDHDKWERLQAMLTDPERRTTVNSPRHTERRYVATGGLSRCANCRQNLQGHVSDRGARTYVCRKEPGKLNCGKVRILAEPYEADLAAKALALLASPNIRAQIAPTEHELAAIPERIRDQQAMLEELDEDRADGVMNRDDWKRMRARVDARINQLKAVQDLAARADTMLTQVSAETEMTPEALADWWETNTIQRRHELLRLVLDHALIHPAIPGYSGYQPGRVEFVWRVQPAG